MSSVQRLSIYLPTSTTVLYLLSSDLSDAQLIEKLQTNEDGYFVVRIESGLSACVWDQEQKGFVRYQETFPGSTNFVRSADVVRNPDCSVIGWFTRDGLNQFLAWPEYLAIDETYKVAFANLRLR